MLASFIPMTHRPPIHIINYDPLWPQQFEDIRSLLAHALGSLALEIEHVGSTAVPGLAAKPILDIDVVIDSLDQLPEVVQILAGVGYRHQGNLGIPDREAFDRSGEDVPRDGSGRAWPHHHLYVCPHDSMELARHLAFRDYLRAHPMETAEYGELKRMLAQQFAGDRNGYFCAKGHFIEEKLEEVFNKL